MVTVPRVNIVRNTSYVVDQGVINKFERLRNQGIHFINFPLYRQANKLQNYEYLNSLDQLKSHVPPTKRLSFEHLNSFIQQYGKVIIKPIYGSKGRGITIIEKDQVSIRLPNFLRKIAYSQ
jgi:glutathione synthase/RimK-type ligase-like ATP-grasp enzyme